MASACQHSLKSACHSSQSPAVLPSSRHQCVPPSPGRHAVVGAGEIRLGDLEIERRLAEGLILGEDDLLGGITVLGF